MFNQTKFTSFHLKSIFLICLFCYFPKSISKMRVLKHTTISSPNVFSFYKNTSKNRKLTSEESAIIELLKLSSSIFNIESYKIEDKKVDSKEQLITSSLIVSKMIKEISSLPNWKKPVSAKKLKIIVKNRELIKKEFGEKSYGWSWFLNQMAEVDQAKKNLKLLYNKDYSKIMSLDHFIFNLSGHSPAKKINLVYSALVSISDIYEIPKLVYKHKKLKIHISNLPQFHIQT